jgi:hypothetical protein
MIRVTTFRVVLIGLIVATPSLLSCQSQPSQQQPAATSDRKGDCGIIYGDQHSFIACAPTGWQLDNESMVKDGIYAAFYPISSTFAEAMKNGTILYVSTMSGTSSDKLTVDEAMQRDAKETVSKSPETVVRALPDLSAGKVTAKVQELFHQGNFDAVAYVQSPNVVVLFVISSATEEGFKKSYPAFKELVRSYQYLTSDIHGAAIKRDGEK